MASTKGENVKEKIVAKGGMAPLNSHPLSVLVWFIYLLSVGLSKVSHFAIWSAERVMDGAEWTHAKVGKYAKGKGR